MTRIIGVAPSTLNVRLITFVSNPGSGSFSNRLMAVDDAFISDDAGYTMVRPRTLYCDLDVTVSSSRLMLSVSKTCPKSRFFVPGAINISVSLNPANEKRRITSSFFSVAIVKAPEWSLTDF